MLSIRNRFKYQDRKTYNANANKKKARVATLILNIADFRIRKFIREKEGHYITVKELIL